MSRRSWFGRSERTADPSSSAGEGATDAGVQVVPFSKSIDRLESWQRAIEDGVIEPHEVVAQRDRLLAMLRELEPLLDDDQHEKVTRVLEEWAVLQAMHGTLLVEEFASGAAVAGSGLVDASAPGGETDEG